MSIRKRLPSELQNTTISLNWEGRNRLSEDRAFALLHLLTHLAGSSFECVNIYMGEELAGSKELTINPAIFTELRRLSGGRDYKVYSKEWENAWTRY